MLAHGARSPHEALGAFKRTGRILTMTGRQSDYTHGGTCRERKWVVVVFVVNVECFSLGVNVAAFFLSGAPS